MITVSYDVQGRIYLETLKAELDQHRDIFWVSNMDKINYTQAVYYPTQVAADGEELKYILHMFENLPIAHGKETMKWYGDHARFITNHLTFADKDKAKTR